MLVLVWESKHRGDYLDRQWLCEIRNDIKLAAVCKLDVDFIEQLLSDALNIGPHALNLLRVKGLHNQ